MDPVQETQQDPSLADELAANLAIDETEEELIETEAAPEIEPLTPPEKWDKRYKEVFSEMGAAENGRAWQQAVLDLYKENQGYTTKVEQERAQIRQQLEQYQPFAQFFESTVAPYQGFMQETGMAPDQFFRQGAAIQMALRKDPQKFIMELARNANIDLRSALEGEAWQSPESKEIQNLQRELQRMKHEQQQQAMSWQQRQIAQLRNENAAQLESFVEATDENGEKLHPHINELQEVMAELIYGRENLRRNNPRLPSMTLEEAYERACKLSPEVAQAMEKQHEADRLAKANAEAKKASRAAQRVPSGRAGKEPSEKTLRQELEDNLNAATAR